MLNKSVRASVEVFTSPFNPPTGLASAADPRRNGPQEVFKKVHFASVKYTCLTFFGFVDLGGVVELCYACTTYQPIHPPTYPTKLLVVGS